MLMKGETFHNFTESLPLFAIPVQSGKTREKGTKERHNCQRTILR